MAIEWPPITPSKRRGSAAQARQRLNELSSPESPDTPTKRPRHSAPASPTKLSKTSAGILANNSKAITLEVSGEQRIVGRQNERVRFLLASSWPVRKESRVATSRHVQDPSGLWISEKLDGVRALWDGKQLWSRRGKQWNAPRWFLDLFPEDLPLDGELWIDRGRFEYTSGVCRSNSQKGWDCVKYMVFDTPGWPQEPVEQRWKRVQTRLPTMPSSEMHQSADNVLELDGEGSTTLLKLKPTLDAEARVLGYEDGQNQCAGLVGSLVCETLDDPPRRFKVGSGLTDALRRDPPAVGSLISFQYGGLGSQGVPRFPRYRGVVADR
ncbi:hypothetical protein MPSI1_003726 [Malassezia psittaci]|uniref:DNA ligase OB-like domain-containing protein n=1 Tax=Malassezia psittaci TaxID=1821823 RepID=A0AAF0FEI8_9BASI|nr:hypothetical protein MPSI1_003726 [Malassezia psittaci]